MALGCWLHRDDQQSLPRSRLTWCIAREDKLVCSSWIAMREELRQLWTRTNVSAEQLVKDP